MNTKEFLKQRIAEDVKMIGNMPLNEVDRVADDWLDDRVKPAPRYNVIREYAPGAKKILDMASGSGGFVYYGLLNGYEAYGIEPEEWKSELIAMKANENNYPSEWVQHFTVGVGEKMSFVDNEFDFVSTYQTLEHVQDVQACINEMIRVTKPGGMIHIQCPNYLSTFEPHYRLPWLPLFPKPLARAYLKMCGANPAYLATINYTTPWSLRRKIAKALEITGKKAEITNLEKLKVQKALAKKGLGFLSVLYPAFVAAMYAKNIFRAVNDVHLLIKVQ